VFQHLHYQRHLNSASQLNHQRPHLSFSGYYLIQLLASQPYTYVVINDPREGVFFNRKLEISGELGKHLKDIAAKVKELKICQEEDISVFQRANQFYFDHFSVDSVHF
jgi:hypothetical protein